ncbi:DNA-binding protein, partial [Oscillospiraceae bacterium 38-13]
MAEDKKPGVTMEAPAPEEQRPEPPAPEAPDTPTPPGLEVLTVEEQLILEHEGRAALFEMGEAIPDASELPGVTIPDPAKEGGQEWEKPQEAAEPPRRGRRPKNKEAPAQGEKPKRKGRPPKSEKQAPGGSGSGRAATTPRQGKAASQPAPAKEEAPSPPAPEEPTQPKDASRGEKEEIVYLDLSDLHPFQNHPFGVRDDNEMKGLVSSVQAGGVHQPALVR